MGSHDAVNILLVDDQPAKLLSYETILAPLGENLLMATSGREALEHLLNREIAVVLADVCMPDLDGFELAALIRDHPRHQRTAIIFVSAVHMTDIDRVRGYESGAVDYVSVPVQPQILRARVSVFADLYRKTRQLEHLNRELEQRVAERTGELTAAAARLRESEAALKEADRRKDEFLAMLAHELRNPLAPIQNAVGILRRRPADESELLWSYDAIDRQVGHLARLVDDLLDVSRITRGSLTVRREPAELGEIVRWAVSGIQPMLAAADLRLRVELPPGPVHAQVDVVRFSQIVHNLLDNACKFSRHGGTIRVTLERDAEGIAIRVRDDGDGLEPHDLPHVFDMFYRSSRGASSARGGLGIGLALVRRLVELHGGTIEARSPGRDQGSEFVIRLPAPDPAPRPAAAQPVRAPEATRPESRRILVVDDNRDSADSLAMLLRKSGHEVRTAYDGLAAVAAAESFGAEVVVLDIGLPLLDGHQVARRIREQPWGRNLLLVAVTGWGQERDRRHSMEAGCDAHLTKPVDRTALENLIAGVVPQV